MKKLEKEIKDLNDLGSRIARMNVAIGPGRTVFLNSHKCVKIAQGGDRLVYKYGDYVVKMSKFDYSGQCSIEARLWSMCDDKIRPYLALIESFGTFEDYKYVVQEYVPLAPSADQVNSLLFLNDYGIWDICDSNVRVTLAGDAKLVDYGVSSL